MKHKMADGANVEIEDIFGIFLGFLVARLVGVSSGNWDTFFKYPELQHKNK